MLMKSGTYGSLRDLLVTYFPFCCEVNHSKVQVYSGYIVTLTYTQLPLHFHSVAIIDGLLSRIYAHPTLPWGLPSNGNVVNVPDIFLHV